MRILGTLSTASIKNLADALGAMGFVKGGYREVISKDAGLSKLGLGVHERGEKREILNKCRVLVLPNIR